MVIANEEAQRRKELAQQAVDAGITVGNGFQPQEKCVVTRPIDQAMELRFQASDTTVVGGVKTFGNTVGRELKDIMSTYGYSDETSFKSFWNGTGGEFVCKIETPSSIISDIASRTIQGPPALNLLVKKEKGLITAAFAPNKPRNYARQNTEIFKSASNNLFASKGLLGSANDLRSMLMQKVLDFSLFAGSIKNLLENTAILFADTLWSPDTGVAGNWVSSVVIDTSKGQPYPGRNVWESMYFKDTTAIGVKNAIDKVNDAVKGIQNGVTSQPANGFPTLPAGGTMYTTANQCGAFAQSVPADATPSGYALSTHVGYVALTDITHPDPTAGGAPILDVSAGNIYNGDTSPYPYTSGQNGWFTVGANKIRIIVFSDAGTPDRFVRENQTTGEIVTFIDTGSGANSIIVGTPTASPITGAIYTSELSSAISTDTRFSPIGSVYYIVGNRNSSPIQTLSGLACIDHSYFITYSKVGNTGYIKAGGNTSPDGSCALTPADPTVAIIDWNKISSPISFKIDFTIPPTITSIFDPRRCQRPGSLTIILDTTTPSGTVITTGADDCPGTGPDAQYSDANATLLTSGIYSVDPLGIPAYTKVSDYNLKYYSPSFSGATAVVENKKLNIVYDDFPANPADASKPKPDSVTPLYTPYPRQTIQNNGETEQINVNPYSVKFVDFYPELNELINEYVEKIRIMLGYDFGTGKKTYFASLADQIGSVPDDDPSYLSVSDVLKRYNDLSEVYQTLFAGVSSEEALEGLDPKFNILSPEEINIKRALIGQRCPSVPPSANSNIALINGCGRFGATTGTTTVGEYNMAKKFIFEENAGGFATNPFTGKTSNVVAGILNLDEMTQQLATLDPDKNIIKLIRLKQILNDLQSIPTKPIIFYGETKAKDIIITTADPKKAVLSGIDTIEVSLRNYPEIETFINMPDKTIADLITAYGFTSTNTKEAYPLISKNLDEIFPDIITQVSDQLKEVFLKRTELQLETARMEASKRMLYFIEYTFDLNPTIQSKFDPKSTIATKLPYMRMKIGETESKIVRLATSTTDYMGIDGVMLGNTKPTTGEYANPDKYFPVVNIDTFLATLPTTMPDPLNPDKPTNDLFKEGVQIRYSLLAEIRKKIKDINKFLGVNVSSFAIDDEVGYYSFGRIPKDLSTVNINGLDEKIKQGVSDIKTYFDGITSVKGATSAVLNSKDPKTGVQKTIYYDIQMKVKDMEGNFNLIKAEVDRIKEEYTSSSNISNRSDIKSLVDLLTKMQGEYNAANGCVGLGMAGITLWDNIGAFFGGLFGGKSAKRKAYQDRLDLCASNAGAFNKDLVNFSSRFICGQ
ncbi:hypothetical protein HY249_01515, partial [Candidatus Azambacteria bacterium]|nr:hypothetical protein [Candidatus Azambacteria bacterium]